MLYVNVYLVDNIWFSPAEGGCYYDAGTPLASIPIQSKREPGKDYYCHDGHVHIRECYTCQGTGQVEMELENYRSDGGPATYISNCPDCGQIPCDLTGTGKLITEMEDLFADGADPYQHQRIDVMLQDHFAEYWPVESPTYE
jgi:hypothetical protein